MIDLFIKNAIVITVDSRRQVLANGAIAIDNTQILEVGPTAALESRYEGQVTLDASDMIAMPGLINCHLHLPEFLMRGVNDDVQTMDNLKNYIWPIQGNYTEADALASSRLGLLEMLKSGTTAFLGTGLHSRYGIDAIAQAVLDSGMRGVLSKYVMDAAGYALDTSALHKGMWEDGEESVRQAEQMIARWDEAGDGRLHIWFSPRSVGGCSPELLRRVGALARQCGVGITAHWAEFKNNVEYTVNTYGMPPFEFAASVGLLGPNVTFAHGVHVTDHEMGLLAESATNICHCPVNNSKLAMGVARVPEMLGVGVNVCLGTDGAPVNNTADMFREMRSALLMHRNAGGDPTRPTAAEAIEMATINGAKAILAEDVAGSLVPGKRADVILIDTRKPHLYPVHDPVSTVVWAANGADVDTVIVDGKIIMRGRDVLTMSEYQVLSDIRARKDQVLTQAGVRPHHVWPIN
jgi:5-methylthioadenosine/S-adenosylhomocysteine deaminase